MESFTSRQPWPRWDAETDKRLSEVVDRIPERTPAMPETHDFIASESFLSYGIEPTCSCGWEAHRSVDTLEEAHEIWDNHCDQVIMEATGG